jgi:hypothetical protein
MGRSLSSRGQRFSRLTGTKSIPLAYYVLDVESEGPTIGYLNGHSIPPTVVDRDGHRYAYAGLAPRCRDGRLDVGALKPNEWIVRPGFVYHLERSTVIP